MKEYQEDMPYEDEGSINIDFKKYTSRLKEHKKTVIWATVISMVLGVALALSLPRQYSTMSKLAPELSNNAVSRLTSLTQLAGLNSSIMGTTDAVYPMVYPDIVNSTSFVVDLFSAPVTFTDKKERVDTTLYGYLTGYQKRSVIGMVLSVPGTMMKWARTLFAGDMPEEDNTAVDPFHLTREQFMVAKMIRKSIDATIDKKTMVVTIVVTMQDPVVSATVSKAVNENLLKYVTAYRTEKAVHDMEYYEKLCDEAKHDYVEAQNKYARYVDYNQGITLQSVKAEMIRLQNEANLKFQLYNSVAQQLQSAQAKVQQETPVFVEIIPPTVPMRPAKPSRKAIVLLITMLGFLGSCTYVIVKHK